MNKIRVTAATTEEAIEEALEQLRIPREALQFRIDRSEEEYLLDDHRPREVALIAWVRPEYVANLARDFLQKLVHLMGFAAEVRVQAGEERIAVLMASPGSSILIGKNGSTLDAIQYLVTRMAGRGGRVLPPIVVDIESYKERKISRLERIARRTAQKVVAEQHEIALPPMTAGDRKIVHTALKDYQGIKTYSQGVEGDRSVVIAPESSPAKGDEEIE
jgi:spoIIIJ-associated protein